MAFARRSDRESWEHKTFPKILFGKAGPATPSSEAAGAIRAPVRNSSQGLAFTGLRKGEAGTGSFTTSVKLGATRAAPARFARIRTRLSRAVGFRMDEIIVKGDPETGTKNWDVRRVPMIPEARALFVRDAFRTRP